MRRDRGGPFCAVACLSIRLADTRTIDHARPSIKAFEPRVPRSDRARGWCRIATVRDGWVRAGGWRIPDMAWLPTLYKARGVPLKSPVCAICLDRTRGKTRQVQLGYGVSVWLCVAHASPEFMSENAGRDFVLTLQRLWQACGCLTAPRNPGARRAPEGDPRPGACPPCPGVVRLAGAAHRGGEGVPRR